MPRYALSFASTELMRDPCQPHHGMAAAHPPIKAGWEISMFRVSNVSEGALQCMQQLGQCG